MRMTERTIKGNALSRGERLQIMLNEDELRAVDDFRFARRMPSRAAAVRALLQEALRGHGFNSDQATPRPLAVVSDSSRDRS
jgi:metal-responsive CopG/Arc/MetJ family transcriptional regulator